MPQTDGGGFGFSAGGGLPQLSGNIAQSGGQELGQRRTLLRQDAADTQGGHMVSRWSDYHIFQSKNVS